MALEDYKKCKHIKNKVDTKSFKKFLRLQEFVRYYRERFLNYLLIRRFKFKKKSIDL